MDTERVQLVTTRLVRNIEQVIIGKRDAIELIIVGLLSRGHILIEDVPGVGKTMLARSLAASLGCSFSRIQFTPDMLPSDVTGVSIFNQKTREFEFRSGPVMAQVVLTDEINRATPKTQASLLEAMQELQVTVDGVTHPLPEPFLVLATQNPIEYEGTFPLPEAQLDRFLMRIRLGYPKPEAEIAILESQRYSHPVTQVQQVVPVAALLAAQEALKNVYLDTLVKKYIVDMVEQTRHHPDIYLGASPRGSLALYRTGQAWAAVQGRDYVLPDDIKHLAIPTLAHRLIVSPAARLKDVSGETVMHEILDSLSVPGADVRPR
ncbi:MAG: AAA family ATPase [Anaerolineae bacterium]|jgi:MoxR-like ATPase